MASIMLSSILAVACIAHAGYAAGGKDTPKQSKQGNSNTPDHDGYPITTCALNKGTCQTTKFVWCDVNSVAVVPKFGTEKPTGVELCVKADENGLVASYLKCHDECPIANNIRVGCIKHGDIDKWVPVQKAIGDPSNMVAGTLKNALAMSDYHCL